MALNRTTPVAVFVSLASLGLAAGLAWQWMLREAVLQRAGRSASLAEILRPRGTELRALLWGLVCLPVFWGGPLTFLSPLLLLKGSREIGFLLPWGVILVLAVLLRLAYVRAGLPPGDVELDPDGLPDAARVAWRRHLKIALYCGGPCLVLMTVLLLAGAVDVLGLAVLVALSLPTALAGPWAGGARALGVLARGARPLSRVERPAKPTSPLRRAAASTASLALVATWLGAVHSLGAGPPGGPGVDRGDFSHSKACEGARPVPGYQPWGISEHWTKLFARAGLRCGAETPHGAIPLRGQDLAWCRTTWTSPERFHFLAVDRAPIRLRGTLELETSSVTGTRAGAVAIVREQGGGTRLVRVGADARLDAQWRVPGRAPVARSDPRLTWGRDALLFVWDPRPRHVGFVRLGLDLVPLGRPVVLRGRATVGDIEEGTQSCLPVSGKGAPHVILDDRGEPWRPGLGEWLIARWWETSLVTWLTAVLLAFAVVVVRARRQVRRFEQSAAHGVPCEGTLSIVDDDSAVLRRADGQVVRVRTRGAARHGFADLEPLSGPCVVVGAPEPAAASAAGYRATLPEIDAAAGFGIVRGDLADARVWAIEERERVTTAAVLLAWALSAPSFVAVFLSL